MTGKTIQTNQLPYWPAILFLCVVICGCNSRTSNSGSPAMNETGTAADHATKAFKNIKFRSYEVIDVKQGGLATYRLAVPQDWKTTSRMDWNYNDLYQPVHARSRVESPDGGSWVENFPSEFFVWVTPPSRQSGNSSGGIDHPNITLPEAMVRYVIVPNRRNAKNLHIVGSRSVNMTKAFPSVFSYLFSHGFREGQGICLAVQYEQDGNRVDEEFYGYMPAEDAIQDNNGPLRLTEYHRVLVLAHSMGAKSGKLESVRPLLGFIATSIEFNPAWMTRLGEVKQMQMDRYNQAMAQTYANIKAAGERSRAISAQNDDFIRQMDANRAAQNRTQQNAPSSSFSADSNEEFDKRTDAFDQYVRGTEHMKDQFGAVSDHSSDYNYHWADGYGNYVHTNDPSNDPNKYLNGNYQRMEPAR
jgi:hypothetical protein